MMYSGCRKSTSAFPVNGKVNEGFACNNSQKFSLKIAKLGTLGLGKELNIEKFETVGTNQKHRY